MARTVVSVLALAGAGTGFVAVDDARGADGTPPQVTWGGREFRSDAELARWLRARGVSYYTWASRHPRASTGLERGTRPASGVPGATASATMPDEPFVNARTFAVLAAALVALVLLLAALAPERVVARGPLVFVDAHRFEIATLAVALGAGAALTVSL